MNNVYFSGEYQFLKLPKGSLYRRVFDKEFGKHGKWEKVKN